MATKAEVRNKALRKIGVLEAGKTADTDDATDVDATYDEIYAYLAQDKAVTWDSDEEVPNNAVRPMVAILAAEIADDFQVPEPKYQRLQVEAYGVGGREKGNGGAKFELQALAQHTYVPKSTTAEYF